MTLVYLGSSPLSVQALEFTRPADTTAYAAGDVVSDNTVTTTIQEIVNFGPANGTTGFIVGAKIATDLKSITPRIRVHLYSVATVTINGDNVAWMDLYVDTPKQLGWFDLPPMITGADTINSTLSSSQDMTLRIPVKLDSATDSIFFVLETLDAFTPASGQKLTLTLLGELN